MTRNIFGIVTQLIIANVQKAIKKICVCCYKKNFKSRKGLLMWCWYSSVHLICCLFLWFQSCWTVVKMIIKDEYCFCWERGKWGIRWFVWIWLLIVLESNSIIIQIGKDLERSLYSSFLLRAESVLNSEQGSGLQQDLETLQGGRLCSFCGQPAPVLHCKPCLPCVQSATPQLKVMSILCSVAPHVLYIAKKVSQVLEQRESLGCFIFWKLVADNKYVRVVLLHPVWPVHHIHLQLECKIKHLAVKLDTNVLWCLWPGFSQLLPFKSAKCFLADHSCAHPGEAGKLGSWT